MILKGTVGHGKEKGRLIGFPTANLVVDEADRVKLPEVKLGVYVSKVEVLGRVFMGITNVGQRPTADDDDAVTIETFVLDFSGNLYDESISVELCKYIRGLHKFESMQALGEQLKADCETARRYFAEMSI